MINPGYLWARRRLTNGALLLLALVTLLGVVWLVVGGLIGSAHAKTSSRGQPVTNRIAIENSQPGTDEWANIGNYNINNLAAYPGATSVNAGSPIAVYVKSSGSSLSARLYRLGYYQNHGARLYATYDNISTSAQPNCTRNSSTGLVRCPWSPEFTINTDPNWVSGVYLLRMDSNNGYRFFVYFIVRNDSYPADFLFVEASKTNQAYNAYGGESLYRSTNNEGRVRAYQVSFDRPYNSGAGTGGLFTHDVDMVRWLEASGYDLTYTSDVDQAADPNFMQGHGVLLEVGHPEYWSWEERDNVDNVRASGKNLVFASANVSWWNVRLEPSSVGPNRIITCYKDQALDPTPVAPHVTVEFDSPLLQRPENQLTGVNYVSYANDAIYNAPWVLAAPPTKWYFDCTGLQSGDQVNNVVGEEWDAVANNGRSPSGLEILSQSSPISPQGYPTLANSVMYTDTNGAKVFSAGSIHWSWGLIDHSYSNEVFQSYAVSSDADHRLEQLMANVLDNFAGYWDGQPRGCGAGNQNFYDIGPRSTRTPKPQAPLATGASPTPTGTRPPYLTLTSTITRTATHTPTITATPSNTATPRATVIASPRATVTSCPVTFKDVHSSDYFYNAVKYLSCAGAVSGYSDGTFRPNDTTTRGQVAKMVALAEGFNLDTRGGPHFTDVPTSNPFYMFIETAYNRGIISGYSDLTFRWGENITRSQLCKVITLASRWTINTGGGPHFSDVPGSDTFYPYVETAYNRAIISGYSNGSFRPNDNATRSQIAKIIYQAVAH